MGSEQYQIGLVSVTNGSQTIIGASTDWSGQVSTPAVFKVGIDVEPTYSIGSVITATRARLAANYTGSTNTGLAYMINRSFTTNRGYWRPYQGDSDLADNLSQETIDEIDTDIANILSGNATITGLYVTGNASIGGNLWLKGNASIDGFLHYAKTENASSITIASLTVPDIPGVTGPVAGYTKLWNKTLATYMYLPYWTRT